MPVAAIHNALEAEAFGGMRDVGLELVTRPLPVVGLGDDARDLAVDIRQTCKLLHVPAPGVEETGFDGGLADMVEHEAHLRALLDHLDDARHLLMKDADVEREIMLGEKLQTLDEAGAGAEFGIGLGLDQAPYTAQELVLAQPVEFARHCLAAFEPKRCDHAGYAPVGPREVRDPFGLIEMLRPIDIDLDKDETFDLHRLGRLGEVFGQDLAVERRRALHPGVTEAGWVAEMHMGIDDRIVGHSGFLRRHGGRIDIARHAARSLFGIATSHKRASFALQCDSGLGSVMDDNDAIDDFDRRILFFLQRDNRISQSEIGEKVHLSSSAVNRRIQRLESNGTIAANVTLVAQEKVGRPITVIVGISVVSEQLALLDQMKERFLEREEIQQCYYVTGDFDFILVLTAKDMKEYEQITRSVFFADKNVKAFKTFVTMDRVKTGLFVPTSI
jgi:Lrp/AsnC family leucine-responsive transcriptional regulator